MPIGHDIAYFFGGVLVTNAIPHFVSAVLGRPFQTPFAKPPGQGLSSSTVNALWGFGNAAVAYGLLARVGDFDWRASDQAGAFGLGVLLMALLTARMFGRLHGGNMPGAA